MAAACMLQSHLLPDVFIIQQASAVWVMPCMCFWQVLVMTVEVSVHIGYSKGANLCFDPKTQCMLSEQILFGVVQMPVVTRSPQHFTGS